MPLSPARILTIRQGGVQPTGSWLYIWVDTRTGEVAYVGATGFDPELRAHLHLESDDPQLARVRATVPEYAHRDFDVLAWVIPEGVDRRAAKENLISRLSGGAEAAEEPGDVTDSIVQSLEDYRRRLNR
ncbi:hypothetical protein [Microbacterium wangruii]|uniref:hypothetical protein n=1 Tax=Microbacterium wangruii TaxID=3049073 RepID=UPI00256EB979|nr:hypothetical protein [Microbacterium sp. zg-Y1211]MDL5486535.1 hypothetical protein [Microbacterium sp. zg-Y1211]